MQTLRTSNRSALLHIPTALRAQTCFSGHDSTSFQNPCAMPKPGEVQSRNLSTVLANFGILHHPVFKRVQPT